MKSITIDELFAQGFTENPEMIKQLQKPFRIPLIVGVGGFALSFLLMMLDKIDGAAGLTLAMGSWCFAVFTMFMMYRSNPKSRHTGKPFLKYRKPELLLRV